MRTFVKEMTIVKKLETHLLFWIWFIRANRNGNQNICHFIKKVHWLGHTNRLRRAKRWLVSVLKITVNICESRSFNIVCIVAKGLANVYTMSDIHNRIRTRKTLEKYDDWNKEICAEINLCFGCTVKLLYFWRWNALKLFTFDGIFRTSKKMKTQNL